MKVINIETYVHPAESKDLMKKEVFQPVRDHKITIQLVDDAQIEAGIFELVTNGRLEVHACISTQAGCKFRCTFCSSGRNGFQRNLSSKEIVQEVAILAQIANLVTFDRLMYMGIGEPLDNFDNVIGSINELLGSSNSYRGNISMATVGVIPRLEQLAQMGLPLRMLWVSLHAVFDEKRVSLMPVTRAAKIVDIISSAVRFAKKTGTSTWINYMILKGFNDGIEDAREFARLLSGTEDHLSVMITRPNGVVPDMVPGEVEDVYRFQGLLRENGLRNNSVRFFAVGNPVEAGCGQFIFQPSERISLD